MEQGTHRRFRSLRINTLGMLGSLVASYLTFPPAGPSWRLKSGRNAPNRVVSEQRRSPRNAWLKSSTRHFGSGASMILPASQHVRLDDQGAVSDGRAGG